MLFQTTVLDVDAKEYNSCNEVFMLSMTFTQTSKSVSLLCWIIARWLICNKPVSHDMQKVTFDFLCLVVRSLPLLPYQVTDILSGQSSSTFCSSPSPFILLNSAQKYSTCSEKIQSIVDGHCCKCIEVCFFLEITWVSLRRLIVPPLNTLSLVKLSANGPPFFPTVQYEIDLRRIISIPQHILLVICT